ncbi:methionine synthase reductase [Hyperolius riggenbachi]|uniref:methionine synthase reductase n=1 Tax=Hyperolius riggenbachi TaxID=752182 RepID=UPI0035A2A1E3
MILFAMCGALKRRFLLLYGTQKGQAKAIAEEISQQADHHGYLTDVFSLEDMEKFSLEKEKDPVVFVISTTGTGDPPETAVKFVRRIQNKDLPNDYLAHLRYGLLALGDSEYTFFCNGGKTVDRRLQELGAKHFYNTGYADDCVGLELVVDPWIEGLWVALKNEFMSRKESQAPDDDTTVLASSQTTQHVAENLDLQMRTLKISNSLTPSGALQKGPDSTAEASLVRSVPPLSQSSLTVPSLPAPYLDVQILHCEGKEAELSSLYPKETVFRVPIAQAKRLTADGAVKTTLMLELDISHTDVDLEPGDSFCVICPNPPNEVTELLNKVQLCERRSCQICLEVKADTRKRGASIPDYIPEKCSVDFVLTWCVEIRATPKKALIRALVEFTSDVAEKRRLQELCSKQGSSDYNRFIRDPSATIVDLLTAFPSCMPPLGLLIEHLPKLQARPYSAASSKLFHPGKLCFVFNIVEFAPCLERREPRRGVCTGWLAELIRGSTTIAETSDENAAVAQMCIFSRPSASFHLPSDTSVPLVMVGPGTGIAPFIGFLQHRQKMRQQNKDWTFGETWLFFGCRSHDKDYLFREELSRFVENGSLTHLKVCFSREPPDDTDENRPKYVQDLMKMYSKHIVRLLTSLNGILYVCGDAKNMAKDVNDALTDMISTELGVDRLEAMKTLASFRDRKQYLQDVWR